MAARSSPINIATKPYSSLTSPRQQQTSNLTSALHSTTGNGRRPSNAANAMTGNGRYTASGNGTGRHDSMGASSGLAPYSGGAQPISMNNSNRTQARRESIAGSMANGMSWGGVSVGSWIRDDVIMQGTSPFPHKSPSYHSSSYMPKLEASFMRDFFCCGLALATLHDLLQHYEECHAQEADLSMMQHQPLQNLPPDPKATITASSGAAIPQQVTQQQQIFQQPQQPQLPAQQRPTMNTSRPNQTFSPTTISQKFQPLAFDMNNYEASMSHSTDMDVAEDMEMDDAPPSNLGGMNLSQRMPGMFAPTSGSQTPQRTHFGQPPTSRVAPLDMQVLNYGPVLQGHQGLKNSQPGTPISGGRPRYQNNPTVSSVNTPTLTAHPRHQQQFRTSPDSSAPGTPGELDPDFVGNVGNITMANNVYGNMAYGQILQQPYDHGHLFGSGADFLELCIDDPAKRLFSPGGGLSNAPQSTHPRLGSAQYGPNSDIARRIRESQVRAGLADTMSGLNNEEPKPFRCPVIGCEKAYKNQNGLKYHKSHGHNTQQLHENPDGTFSIVDPTTSTPYPGTLGMEKEKPYKCDKCGKRYKNLNGLKYHKSHSDPCNPDLRSVVGHTTDGQDINVAGAAM